jgi:hypothetical protein
MDVEKIQYHFDKIYNVCGNTFSDGCGSYLFDGKDYVYNQKFYNKQKLIYDVAKKASDVLEIGVYMGHSLLIMLVANPNLKIVGIDINDKYSVPAINYLKKNFNCSKITFIKGNSLKVLPNLVKENRLFDFIHIDGNHDNNFITKEFKYCINLSKNIMNLVLDDVEACLHLKNNISKNFKPQLVLSPDSPSPNCLFKISMQCINYSSLNKFRIQNFKDELILFPKRIIKLIFYFFIFFCIYKLTPNKIIKLAKDNLFLNSLINKIKNFF